MSDFAVAVVVVVAAIVVAAAVCPNTAVGKEYWISSLPKAPICASMCQGASNSVKGWGARQSARIGWLYGSLMGGWMGDSAPEPHRMPPPEPQAQPAAA